MARSVSLTTLLTRVRQRADIENATARFTDAEITDHINEAIAEFYDVVRASWGEDYFRSSFPITTVSGQLVYSLPADFLSLISVDVMLGSLAVASGRPFMENERNWLRSFPTALWIVGDRFYYRLAASNITLQTAPSGYSISLNYIPTPPKLATGGDTVDGIAGWEEYVVLDAAIKCMLKDQDMEMVAALEQRKAGIKARIDTMATERDAGQTSRVQDVVGERIWDDY